MSSAVGVELAPEDDLRGFDLVLGYPQATLQVDGAAAVVLDERWAASATVEPGNPGKLRVSSTTATPCPPGSTCPLFTVVWSAGSERPVGGPTTISIEEAVLSGSEGGTRTVLRNVTLVGVVVVVQSVGSAEPAGSAGSGPATAATALGAGARPTGAASGAAIEPSAAAGVTPSPAPTAIGSGVVSTPVAAPGGAPPGRGTPEELPDAPSDPFIEIALTAALLLTAGGVGASVWARRRAPRPTPAQLPALGTAAQADRAGRPLDAAAVSRYFDLIEALGTTDAADLNLQEMPGAEEGGFPDAAG